MRVVIEGVEPEIDCGQFPIKRVTGELVEVEADVFADGHDLLACRLRWRAAGEAEWRETPMQPTENDRWRGAFVVEQLGGYEYTIRAWVDRFATWRRDVEKKAGAGQDVSLDMLEGALLVEEAARGAPEGEASALAEFAASLRNGVSVEEALREDLAALVERHLPPWFPVEYERVLRVVVDRPRARFSTWYELFPRSLGAHEGRHGTLADVEEALPRIARMGFDVLYLPPIHPIGRTNRKGPNNNPEGSPEDLGSPWAIGAEEGGHTDIHPALGTFEDFDRLVRAAEGYGIEIAMDVAFQCAPDHPWVQKHPGWFRKRADGSIAYAENPPKRYEDIYPLDFETDEWEELWHELREVVRFWIGHGVKIFRVDNPHTKALRFWEWLIATVKQDHPEVIFLSEAFTRPKVMYRLAKLGFTQSYTYFAWRNAKWELTEYFTELTRTRVREFFRPNLWPNTPDILTEQLQHGGRPAFAARLVLAATLGASYGIYGPAFELHENRAVAPGREEYLDSEKYQLRAWDVHRADSLEPLVTVVNRVRRENAALHADRSLVFHHVDNDQIIAYSKADEERRNVVLTIVNLDPWHTQAGFTWLNLDELAVGHHEPFQVHDQLTGARYLWEGPRNYVELNPHVMPAHVFVIRRRTRDERDFEYFM